MSIESLVTLKDRYDNNGRPNFGNQVLNILVDEIVALDTKANANNTAIAALAVVVRDLQTRVNTLEGV